MPELSDEACTDIVEACVCITCRLASGGFDGAHGYLGSLPETRAG